ncbi:MAG: hypothetical protein GKR97_17100 [Rhizobiaceae bacterium]|nr:hypothetical protein [Rhizobiaceae bacterium]
MSIKEVQERKIEIFKNRPAAAQSTGQTNVLLSSGTRCEISQDDWKMVCGQPKQSGGGSEGPDPGVFGRGALGACLAQGYALHLARRELSFESISIEVQSDIDARGSIGMDDAIPPGYQALRLKVQIESREDANAIREAIDFADQHSPWLYNLITAIPAERDIVVRTVS